MERWPQTGSLQKRANGLLHIKDLHKKNSSSADALSHRKPIISINILEYMLSWTDSISGNDYCKKTISSVYLIILCKLIALISVNLIASS